MKKNSTWVDKLTPEQKKKRKKRMRSALEKSWKRKKVLSGASCAHCGSTENLTVDHIKPLSKGGTNSRHNLQALCKGCNEKKADKWRAA